jgi:ribosomal protein S2
MDISDLVQDEINYLKDNGFVKNENGQYIYTSKNGVHSINLPHILLDYKEYLFEKYNIKP